MTIQLAAIKRLSDGPIQAWLDVPRLPGVALLVEFAPLEAVQALYGLDKSPDKQKDPTDEEFRDWWLARVKDWRGVLDGDAPARFDREALVAVWKADALFRAWLIGGAQELASFLDRADEAPAVAVGAGLKRATARRAR